MEITCFKFFYLRYLGTTWLEEQVRKKKRYQREILELEGISYQNQESLIAYRFQNSRLLLKWAKDWYRFLWKE